MNRHNQKYRCSHCVFSLAAGGGAVFVALVLMNLPFLAQQPDAAAKQQMVQEKVAALKQSLAQNQAALTESRKIL